MSRQEVNALTLMNKYPIFGLGVAIALLGVFSRFIFKINLFWLVYVGVAVMFFGLFMGFYKRR